jgi:alternative NADH:quinone oxidoreductase NDH2-like protein
MFLPRRRDSSNGIPTVYEQDVGSLDGDHMIETRKGGARSGERERMTAKRGGTSSRKRETAADRGQYSLSEVDCAAIPGPDGRYPALAQHAIREARQLAENIGAVIDGRVASAFMFRSLGTMASLGHTRAVARVFGVRLTGFLAWWLRRPYYLLQMPRWDQRLRIVLDWTVALFFRPDITRVDLRWNGTL